MAPNPRKFESFKDFYPFYLSQHSNLINRRLHAFGTFLALLTIIIQIITFDFSRWYMPLICGYGFAWVGHFFFEQNKPATFQHPFYSFMGDFVMMKDILTGKLKA
ncbi:hypothetical protein PPERSA_05287 [Pseudocohnilembus persalinus]|uniref:DUF962 domain-containing protein n=1 Tax=Pseudocohnilembus persalinus TaxID=266149 RepID=A0A0V0R5Z2_PSEPJ|nr:hypothetical protein PPERSA_05287 [Pseudocohnilembus persalinus]|eukprot:KRX09895.1 hypothetical protein PPERSA_05287 [Pseudocohnilembus persalinus]